MLRNIIVLIFVCLVTNLHAQGLLQNEDFKTESELITAGGSKSQLLNDTKIYVTADGINETLDDAISLGLLGFQSPLTTDGDLLAFISGSNVRLPIGTNGQLLTVVSGVPAWADAPVTLPDQTGEAGNYLKTNGTSASWEDVNYDIARIKTNQINCPSFEGCDASEWVVTNSAGTLLPLVGFRTIHTSSRNDKNLQVAAIGSVADISATLTKTVNLSGVQLKAYCEILATEDGYTFKAGANGVVQGQHEIIGDTKFRFYEIYVTGGDTSQFIEISKDGASDGAGLQVDNCFIGKVSPTDIREVSGAQLVGNIKWAGKASCSWVVTSPSYTSVSANANCNDGVITGNLVSSNLKHPSITIPNARTDGFYRIRLSGVITLTSFSTTATSYATLEHNGERIHTSTRSNSQTFFPALEGEIKFTSSGDKYIEPKFATSNAANPMGIYADNADRPLTYSVYFFPDSTSNIVTQNTELTATTANEFVANVSSTGVVSGENFDWINGNCTNAIPMVCTFNTNIFSVAPICQVTTTKTSGGEFGAVVTQNNVTIYRSNSAGGAEAVAGVMIECTRSTDYNKSATIIGKFENINSSELVKVEANTSSLTSIGSAVFTTVTYSNEVFDNYNSFNPSTGEFTVPRDGFYSLSATASIVNATGSDRIIEFFKNGTNFIRGVRVAPTGVTGLVVTANNIRLQQGDVITARVYSGNGATVETLAQAATFLVTELPDTESIIKNLSNQKTKCQTKVLSANVNAGTTGTISDFTFNNLTVGKKYEYNTNIKSFESTTATNIKTVTLQFFNGASVVGVFSSMYGNVAYARYPVNLNKKFIATSTTFTTNVASLDFMLLIATSGSESSFVELCELPDTYVETTEW